MTLKARRDRRGNIRLQLDAGEADVLCTLPDRLSSVVREPDFDDKVVQRLFPPAYTDPEREMEYRELLGNDLRRKKLESIETFERTLQAAERRGNRVKITIASKDFDLWLAFINDMRLMLGVKLDIQEDGWGSEFDPHHPQAHEMALLHYLSFLEEILIQAAGSGQ